MEEEVKSVAAILRQKAEDKLRSNPLKSGSSLSEVDTLRLIHEMEVHQIELEMQNEELRLGKQSESQSEKLYRDLFNSLIEGYCLIEMIFDENKKPVDYRFLEINEAFQEQTGLMDAEGKSMRDLAPGHEEYWFEIYGNVALTGETVQFENEAKALNRWFDVRAFRMGGQESRNVAVCFNDITQRKRGEEELRKSERRYSALFANKINGMAHCRIITDEQGKPIDYRILQINEAYERIIGIKKADIEGLRVLEVFPDIQHYAIDYIGMYGRIALENGEISFEEFFEATQQYLSIYAYSPIPGEFIAIFTDVTDRKRAEEVLAFQARLLTEVQEAVFSSDINFTITYWNQAAERIFGWTKEEALGKNSGELLKPKIEGSTRDQERSKLRNEGSWEGEAQYIRKDGTYIFVEINSTLLEDAKVKNIGHLVVCRDITERKRAEAELRQSEERYKSIFQNNHSVMLLINPETGEIIDANPAACSYYGWSIAEMCSRNISDFNVLSPEEVAAEMKKAKEEKRNHFFFRHRLATDVIRDVEVYSSPLQFGDTTLLYSIIHDITERKQAENALHESEEKVRFKLQSILSPEGNIADLELNDIIDVVSIQQLMDNFYELAQIPMAIIDVSGKVVVGVGWQEVCTKFHRVNPLSCANCIESDVYLTQGIPDGEFRLYKCKNNMWDMATPLMIGGEHKGNLFMGQFFFEDEPIDYNLFRKQAVQYGFAEKEFMAALDKVPHLSLYKLNHAKAFFLNLSRSISQLSYSNIKLARAITQQKQTQEAILASERIMDAILNGVTESIMMLDTDGKILAANQTAAERWDISVADLRGRNIYSFIAPESQKRLPAQIQELIETGLPIRFEDQRENRYYHLTFYPAPETSGEIKKFVVFNSDITELKRIEESLKESEKKYRELVKYAPTAIYEFNYKTQKIVTANDAMVQLSGYPREELFSMNVIDLLDEESKITFMTRMEGMLKGEKQDEYVEYKARTKNGRLLHVVLRIKFKIDEHGKHIGATVILHDITERIKMEEALRESEQKLSEIYDSMTEGLASHELIYDHSGKAVDYLITEVNPAYEKITGIKQTEVKGKKASEIYSLEEAPYLDVYAQVESTGKSTSFETYFPPMNKHFLISVFSPGKEKFATIFQDITDRKLSEESLRISEERFRNLVNDIPIGVILFGSKAEVILSNPKAMELLGVNENKVKDNYTISDWETIHEDGTPFPKSERPVPRTFATGQSVQDVVIGVYRHATSDYIWLLINTVTVLQEDGTIRNVIGTFIDITQQKKAEDEVKASEVKFSLIYEKSPFAISLSRLSDGRIEQVNEAFVTIFGYPKDEAIGKKSDEFVLFPKHSENILNEFKNNGFAHDLEGVFYKKSGEARMLRYNIDIVESGGQKYMLHTAEDITTRKEIEEALRESEFFFRESQQAAFIGSFKTDFKTGLWESSEVLDRIFGIDKNYNRSIEDWYNLVYPDDRQLLSQHIREEVIKKGLPFNKEFRIIRNDNVETRWVHGMGRVGYDGNNKIESLVGTLQDITQRKVKEEKLRKLNKTLSALSKSSQVMSQAVDENLYLKQVCKIVVEDIDFAMVWIGYAEEDDARTIRPVASAGFKDDYLQSIKISWDDSELGQGPTGTAIRTGNISMCNNMYTDPAFEPWREQALKRGYASSIVFPLKSDDKTFGAITIYSKETDSFLEDEIKLISELAKDLSHGITTIRLRSAHKMAEEALAKSYSELEVQVKERTNELQIANDLLKKEINTGKQHEQSLKLAEEKYRTVADHTHGWEFWLDKDDNFLYCSPSCERITGYKASEFLKKPELLYDIIHPIDKKRFLRHKKTEDLCQVKDYELEYRIVRNDGSIRWIGHECQPITDESGNFMGVRGSNKDITGRKEIEQLLRTSSRKYRLLSVNITDGIFICKNGYFEYVNKSMKRIFGYSHYKMEGSMFIQLALPEYHEELKNILSISSTVNQLRNVEIECLKKDHSIIDVEILFHYVAKEKMIYGVVHDITEKKQIQKNIVKAIIMTEENERAHFSKELHDGLGPLLSTIKLYLQCSERPKAHTSRNEIIHQAEDVLEEALTTVKEISNKLSPHLLTNYGLTSAIQSFVDKLVESSVLKIDFKSNVGRRLGNEFEAALYRAVIECINNTIKHAKADSISIILKDIDDQIQVQYLDNGIGFNVEETLSKNEGLGLFNLQNRIENIGGKIHMVSSPGMGVNYQINVNL